MNPICSVLIPSRFRFDRVLNTVRSVFSAADDPSSVEVVLRFHVSDTASVGRVSELEQFGQNVRYILGEDLGGYNSLHEFCQELELVAKGDWHWHVNDDMLIEKRGAHGFDTLLKKIPLSGFLVQPGIHQLNTSKYDKDPHSPAPIYPATSLKECGCDAMPNPPDIGIYQVLVGNSGWKIQYLEGIAIWHQWNGHQQSVNQM